MQHHLLKGCISFMGPFTFYQKPMSYIVFISLEVLMEFYWPICLYSFPFFSETDLLCSVVFPQILCLPVSAFWLLGLYACMMVHDDAKIFACLSSLCHIMCDETENIDSFYFMDLFQNS